MKKLLLVVFCLLLTGCPKPVITSPVKQPTQFTTVLGGKHLDKEKTIEGAANNIDDANKKDSNNLVITENVEVIKEEIKKAPTQELLDAAKNDNANKDATIKVLEASVVKLQEYIKKLEDSIKNNQVIWFNSIGAGCILLALLAGWLKQPQWAILLLVVGLVCLGVAQIVGLYWFKWAVMGAGFIGFFMLVGTLAYSYYKHQQQMSVDKEATDYYDVLIKLIPVFDKAYKNADVDTRKWLDSNLVEIWGRAYNEKDKAMIHTIRADLALMKK